jgi:hypothetical protein
MILYYNPIYDLIGELQECGALLKINDDGYYMPLGGYWSKI